MAVQNENSLKRNEEMVGKTYEVHCRRTERQ